MKAYKYFIVLAVLVLFSISSYSQVQFDKQIQLTGSGTDAKVTGIKDVNSAEDATSAAIVQSGNLNYGTAGGTANTITISLTPAPTSYMAGMMVNFLASADNTGAVTLNVNSLGNISIKKSVTTDLAAADIKSGQMVSVIYDGVNFQLLNQVQTGSSSSSNMVYSFTANKTLVSCTAGFSTVNNPITFTSDLVSGTGSSVLLTVSGLPSGVTYNINPGGGFPYFTASLVLYVSGSVSQGSYTFTVTATGGSISPQSITITLRVAPYRVFITSQSYNGNLGGLTGADAKCQARASAAGITGTYTAWLSSTTVCAKDRLSEGVFVRIDGASIASSIADLTDGTLANPINRSESGAVVSSNVWTGTRQNGCLFKDSGGEYTAENWTNSTGVQASYGVSDNSNFNWTYTNNTFGSSSTLPIYCFEK